MASKESKHAGREKIIEMVRKTFEEAKGAPVTFQKFLADSGMKKHQVFVHFANWTEVLRATGLAATPLTRKADHDAMLADWGVVARKVGRYPTHNEYGLIGKFNYNTLRRWFGSWKNLMAEFRKFAGEKTEWTDVVALLNKGKAEQKKRLMKGLNTAKKKMAAGLASRPSCGAPLNLDAMRHAPVNEAGVVFLFGIVARQLGFVVDSLHSYFPDCQAKREVEPDVWKPVAIEFEYESRNFQMHRHPVDGCDVIVCWRHNWVDCPKNLQIVALSEEIKRLGQV